ncbi:hypothetical protein P7K49_019075 [Saguinus oedipus]|uniref:Uncharacterized protein n=1 Tax=Saguinus oedipus TaxID=9490 RepID=A0ABQ9UXA6_SAGOE|nr:hypothetical protein P7K49_019075 [Saguinus oedipus]
MNALGGQGQESGQAIHSLLRHLPFGVSPWLQGRGCDTHPTIPARTRTRGRRKREPEFSASDWVSEDKPKSDEEGLWGAYGVLPGDAPARNPAFHTHVALSTAGYYTQISTLADTQENVMEYLHVLSRPMVINHDHDIIWTEAYMDSKLLSSQTQSLTLLTTVAMPVFSKKNETRSHGILLGVVGSDVALRELMKLAPRYRVSLGLFPVGITRSQGATSLLPHGGSLSPDKPSPELG